MFGGHPPPFFHVGKDAAGVAIEPCGRGPRGALGLCGRRRLGLTTQGQIFLPQQFKLRMLGVKPFQVIAQILRRRDRSRIDFGSSNCGLRSR